MKRTHMFCFYTTKPFSTTIRFFLLSILIIILSTCKNSVDLIIDDYNSNYEIKYISSSGPGPGEEGFDASMMLMDKYFIGTNETLNLTAPNNCSYEWELTDYEDEKRNKNFATLSSGSDYNTQRFILYVPTSGITDGYYKLRLIVTDKEGNKYTDNSILIIYKDTFIKE